MNYRFFTAAIVLLLFTGCRFAGEPAYSDFTTRFTGERTELYVHGELWGFDRFVKAEISAHPEMKCEDLIKLCCQAARGIDGSRKKLRENFNSDYASTESNSSADLIRVVSPDIARVDLAAWKAAGLPQEWLFRMSIMESEFSDSEKKLHEYLKTAEKIVAASDLSFSADEFRHTAEKYLASPIPRSHLKHSESYRNSCGKYRIISTRLLHTIPVLQKAASLPDKSARHIIAVDGRSASGKTTIARQLKVILDGQIIHMDDFFLPPEKRTAVRYDEPGGNVHYERFKEEVLPQLAGAEAFSYRIFDCKLQNFNGNRIIWKTRWLIVEGAYSHHPQFGNYADLKIFYDITPEEQMRRIYERNGAHNAQIFRNKWIPLEEKYIKAFDIIRNADMIIK